MKLELHHINVCSKDVPHLNEFYRNILQLGGIDDDEHVQDTSKGYYSGVEFATDGNIEFHLATTDLGVSYRSQIYAEMIDEE